MASATATSSPSCPQLRLAFNSGKCRGASSPSLLVRARPRKLNRNVRLLCVAQSGTGRSRNWSSWAVSSSSSSTKDNFAGWSDSANGEDQSKSEGKNWFGGNVTAGAAGLVLVAGVTLAGLALNKRSTSRPEQQIEPLTPQQEAFLSSERDDDGSLDDKTAEDHGKTDVSGLETEEDIASSPELDEMKGENKLGNDEKLSPAGNGEEAIGLAVAASSANEEFETVLSIDEDLVVREMNSYSSQNDLSAEIESGRSISSNMQSVAVAEETLVVDKPGAAPDSLNSNIGEVMDLSALKFEENSISLTSSRSVVDEVVEPNAALVSDSSQSENLDQSETVPLKTENTASTVDVNYLQENVSPETSLPSSSPSTNELEGILTEPDESRLFSESQVPLSSFSSVGIPAPSAVSEALRVPPGKLLVPAAIDQGQGQALAALQVLKVIEADAQPGDLCSRREYARWLISASGLSRNPVSKVYPAMYIEKVTELAFDDVTPDDPDFASIQGLAEAGLISSKLSSRDLKSASVEEEEEPSYFSPESPLSRQDLVSWKVALEKRQLPEADKKILYQVSGFRDIDRIHPDAWPALVADLSAGDQGIISLAFGCTRLFQPDKPVTKAQAAIALALGEASDIVSEELARIEAESMAENAVSAHNAIVAEVEQDINASFEKELSIEREKINAVERMAEEAKSELAKLKAQREEDNISLIKERAAIESEMEVLTRIRREMEEQLENLLTDKVAISYEKERISKLQKQAEEEKQEVSRLQYELEVERKALSMARAWAEDEAKRARDQAKALEEARDRWEKQGIKVVVDSDLQEEETSPAGTWVSASEQFSVEETLARAETLTDKLKLLSARVTGKSKEIINTIVQKILAFISALREWASRTGARAEQAKEDAVSKVTEFSTTVKEKAAGSLEEMQQGTAEFGSTVKEGAKRVAGDCKEGVEKLTQRFVKSS
ncbi:unnamed protein product [Linum tenue]|uniref:SLH domain-containing protein n=1 Tax=Linum tenue TaxID=586396 RepID=A0AAV0QME0_9ROSI|nr:unnamed protein product [Linum tenue]